MSTTSSTSNTSLSGTISFATTLSSGKPPNASTGHYIRLQRILKPEDNHTIIIPLDHGMSRGPLPGIVNPRQVVADAVAGKADAIMLHAGLARRVADLYGNRLAAIFKLSASGTAGADHVLLGSIEQAIRYAADAVCVELKLGSPNELKTMRMISQVKHEAERYDLPVMITAYAYPPYREKVGNQSIVNVCRIAGELGADIVKTAYPGDRDTFARIIEGTPAPVVVAGGELVKQEDLLLMIAQVMQAGAAGVAIGRNIWGAKNPQALLSAIKSIVHRTLDDTAPVT